VRTSERGGRAIEPSTDQRPAGTLLARITRSPRVHDAEQAAEITRAFADLPPEARSLLAATASCSGFLSGLITREAAWLREAFAARPEATLATLLADAAADSPEALAATLRVARRRTALLVALADLGGAWGLSAVTGALSALADRAVSLGLETLVAAEAARGKLPGIGPQEAADAAGMFVLAMGKLGGGELNYSSDVDLIVLFDETRHDEADYGELRRGFIRITQRLVKLLQEQTGEGYVFRTDLRLRPDPSVTPVCIATEPAERYYESLGRTWERAAFIKARPCAGAIDAGWAFLERLRPFVWRRHLDYAAIQDAHDMRLRIRKHKGLTGPLSVLEHDMKLGQGGIREIEFFTQTRQLIVGGRDPGLRQRQTLTALAALAERGWVDRGTAGELAGAYVAHREVEHRLQMLEDAQTHRIPATEAEFARLAAFMDTDPKQLAATLRDRLERVSGLTEPFFAPDEAPASGPAVEEVFADPEAARSRMTSWARLPAFRTQRARQIFRRIEPQLLARLARAADPDRGLAAFDAFLGGLPAGVQLFSLVEANPSLLDLLVDVCASTPELARYLGRNAGVLDAVISGDFYRPLRGASELAPELAHRLAEADDYERALNASRIWMKERHFRIGVHLLRGLASPDEAAAAYSACAEAALRALYPVVVGDFTRRFGPPPGAGAVVLGMGKLGSREMTATSDLDLIVIYDPDGTEESTGRKPLPVQTYYARLTQALIAALTAPMADGTLYRVDMRLRPSGRAGPVAVSLPAFRRYQTEEAWTWEHLALTRARVVAGPPPLGEAVTAAVAEVIRRPHDPGTVLTDARDMRRRLAAAHEAAAAHPWEVKLGPGRMMDIELIAQTGALLHGLADTRRPRRMLDRLGRIGWLPPDDARLLAAALDRLSVIQQIMRLASDRTMSPEEGGAGLEALILAATGSADLAALEARLAGDRAAAEAAIARRLEAEPGRDHAEDRGHAADLA
jgi:glutamate-ammonia-ligase adenylyltransferase